MRPTRQRAFRIAVLALVGCAGGEANGTAGGALAESCARGNGGITLPEGFCAIVVADDLAGARHLAVAPNGDVFVARMNGRPESDGSFERGGLTLLRDTSGDGEADLVLHFGDNGGNDVLVSGDYLYFATNDAVLRYVLPTDGAAPTAGPDTIVAGLPDAESHNYKSIALGPDGALYVNIGAPSNACGEMDRATRSRGRDPCPELEARGGIWRFAADRLGQSQGDGVRYATGLRNTVALSIDPSDGRLYGAVHGRDQLHGLWPDLFTVEDNAEKPSEEFVLIEEGADFGWPYCYHDRSTGRKVLAPEYGGDGERVDRCADKATPLIGFPAHWAPNDLEFYWGEQFPERYRGGAFIAFHGSWDRAPLPQDGYRVVFVPRTESGSFASDWEVFADDFMEAGFLADFRRPVGLAVGPDGSLFISDSVGGRIWRVVYRGS